MARTNLKVTDGIAIDFYDDGNSNKGSIYLDNGAFVFSGTCQKVTPNLTVNSFISGYL